MPTLTDAGVDLDTIDHLDWGTPCTIGVVIQLQPAGNEPCPNAATWDMTCRRCAGSSPICDDHKRTITRMDRGACQRCKAAGRPARMFTFFRIGGDR